VFMRVLMTLKSAKISSTISSKLSLRNGLRNRRCDAHLTARKEHLALRKSLSPLSAHLPEKQAVSTHVCAAVSQVGAS
jgi:hypothetical protein